MLDASLSARSAEFIELEALYGAHNYHPLPVVLERGKGVHLWDVDGKRYMDFLSGYSAVNQGHCHPRILETLVEQAQQLTLTSRAFYTDKLSALQVFLNELFGYDKSLIMNSGAEAVETAMKLSRKWGYKEKKVPDGQAKILFASNNFHGRTIAVISASSDPVSRRDFAPYVGGVECIPYNDLPALEKRLSEDKNIVAFIVEPIQGEAGVILPDESYMSGVAKLCRQYNVLFVADEIQTGLGRTGQLLATYMDGKNKVRPDIVILGKAISGGFLPVSAVLADDPIMLCLKPGEHGSTYGGNPLAAAVSKKALQVLIDEKMPENALEMGDILREGLKGLASKYGILKSVRGKGLLNAIVINTDEESKMAWNMCLSMKEHGLLAKPTHGNKIRLAPPLVINREQIEEALNIIETALKIAG